MNKKQAVIGFIVLAALVALVVWGRGRIHFDFALFRAQLAHANWGKIVLAVGCIYVGYLFRSVRWALLVRHNKRIPPFSLIGTQVIGFTAVALLGRVADPVRPFLVSKKTGLQLSSQVAVYIVERLLDLGAMAIIFSTVILFAPAGALPHPEIMKRSGYGAMAITLLGVLFLVGIRLAGHRVASVFERVIGLLSQKTGHAVAQKIHSFQAGLDTLRTPLDCVVALTLSLTMWGLITLAYLETTQAFVASPQLASMTLPKCMLLLAASGGASALQLPIIGWFTQIGFVAAALSGFFGAATEPATACAATLLLVTFLSIVPVGLIWAQLDHVSLSKVAAESEHAEEVLEEETVG